MNIHGVTFLFLRGSGVLLERCPKKASILGVGEWFVPGGKIEPGETPEEACEREVYEELRVMVRELRPLPIVEGSRVPPGPAGLFLMRPFVVVRYDGTLPIDGGRAFTVDEAVPLRWTPIIDALASPVPQVRMMVAAAAYG